MIQIETPQVADTVIRRIVMFIILSGVGLILAIPTSFVFGLLIKCTVKLFNYGFNLWT